MVFVTMFEIKHTLCIQIQGQPPPIKKFLYLIILSRLRMGGAYLYSPMYLHDVTGTGLAF
jgi:hypothetical protein